MTTPEDVLTETLRQSLDMLALRVESARGGYPLHALIPSERGAIENLARSLGARLPAAAPPPEPPALREALDLLRRGVEIAAVMPNGYHVCRWCGVADAHEPGCQWVRHTRETTEWKADARAALDRDPVTPE